MVDRGERRQAGTRWLLPMLICLALAPAGAQVDDEGASSAFLGVQMVPAVTPDGTGALVTRLVPGSPAAASGILVGDVLESFDGETVDGPEAVTRGIRRHRPGDRVTLELRRGDRRRTVEVRLGDATGAAVVPRLVDPPSTDSPPTPPEAPAPRSAPLLVVPSRPSDPEPPPRPPSPRSFWSLGAARPVLGVQLVETTPELREHLGGRDDAGVLVSKVLDGSAARRAGLRVGDLILEVDGVPVASSSELVAALRDKIGRDFPVTVVREGRTRTVEVSIPEPRPATGPQA